MPFRCAHHTAPRSAERLHAYGDCDLQVGLTGRGSARYVTAWGYSTAEGTRVRSASELREGQGSRRALVQWGLADADLVDLLDEVVAAIPSAIEAHVAMSCDPGGVHLHLYICTCGVGAIC